MIPLAVLLLSGCGGSSNNIASTEDDNSGTTPAELFAMHRSGQTFLRWPESDPNARYHVYRHSFPIDSANLSDATRLTERWGSLSADSSVNHHGSKNVPANFVVDELGSPLSNSTGFFVYTIQDGEEGPSYYAVTTVENSVERTDMLTDGYSLAAPVSESVATPQPVLVASQNNGKGRVYIQYMDYLNWNPTFNGYAYDFGVTLPFNYTPAQSYPLQLNLHAFGQSYDYLAETPFGWETIQLTPTDPGEDQNSIHSWWYGYSADHNYQTGGDTPFSGTIRNFTEQRVLAAVRSILNDPTIATDSDLVHIVGNSMGASGAVSLALRYPGVFSGIYASEPMINYSTSPTFQNHFVQLWGNQSDNLPIVNSGPDSESIQRYGKNGPEATGVWDWMNHLQQIRRRNADDFAYLMIDHGKADTTIDWQTQGQPLIAALTDARAGFSANAFEGIGHSWLAFGAVVSSMFGLGFDDQAPWRYPLPLSYPAISNASGSSAISQGTIGDASYNTNIEWSTPENNFDRPIIDSSDRYEISLRSLDSAQTADITPRRTRMFKPSAGQQCTWLAVRIDDGQTAGGGSVAAQEDNRVTIPSVRIHTGSGTRLVVSC
ncbi:hypothetical protein AB833_20640 [Chromatiales bacterium (ex Bugula neritina AB1)]|nr:hypothetical protein AB833_20640 [Chromatiales bacterium (ex Bugula neritina AB1)]